MDKSTLLSLFTIIGGLGGIAGIVYLYSTVFKPGNFRVTVASKGRSANEHLNRSGVRCFELHIPVMIQNTGARPISVHAMNWTINKPDWLTVKVLSVPQFVNTVDAFVLEPKKMLSSNISMIIDLRGGKKGRDLSVSQDQLDDFKLDNREKVCLQVGCDIIGKYSVLDKRKAHHMQKTFDITKQVKQNIFLEE